MPKGKGRKTKKFLQFYGPDYVEKSKKEKEKETREHGKEDPP